MKRICVFCGSTLGRRAVYADAARAMAAALLDRGLGLVYGGGSVGLMGTLADAVLAGGGEVIGVLPKGLARKELAHRGLTELHLVASMHERKALMASLADGFVALPGGLGTLEEVLEILVAQLGIHQKPVGVVDVDGYWTASASRHAAQEGFVRPEYATLLLVETAPGAPPPLRRVAGGRRAVRWLDATETRPRVSQRSTIDPPPGRSWSSCAPSGASARWPSRSATRVVPLYHSVRPARPSSCGAGRRGAGSR